MTDNKQIPVGVSQCLLGEEVRFDGGHQHDSHITDTLGAFFRFTPVCPEVEAGFGVPREPMRLEGDPAAPRVISHRTRRDLTRPLADACAALVARVANADLQGFILKDNSPSCGLERVRVYNDSGAPRRNGAGLFARCLIKALPLLPVEEAGRLNDAHLRENFIERVFVHHRWRGLLQDPSAKGLVEFHTRHKFLLMAHSPVHMRRLGNLVGGMKKNRPPPWDEYGLLLMEAMGRMATPKKHVDVILHMMGFLKKQLGADEKAEMLALLESYKKGDAPLTVPVSLLNHHVRKFDPPHLNDQWYLRPHPAELKLRYHV